jgi:hypothetical protein
MHVEMIPSHYMPVWRKKKCGPNERVASEAEFDAPRWQSRRMAGPAKEHAILIDNSQS